MPRLLICHRCKTIDELPSYVGPPLAPGEPEPLLLKAISEHHQHGPMLIGGPQEEMALAEVDDIEWMRQDLRDEVLRRFKQQWSGFEPELYHLRATFQDDALRCFSNHHRPKEGCLDWMDHSKLLTPSTWHTAAEEQIDRADLKIITEQTSHHRKPVYLCNFCPVQTYVTRKAREQRGMYNRAPGETE